jgi:ketosteroid isomerase-like protein
VSQESVEIVRRLCDAANRRDLGTMDALGTEESEFRSVLAASEGRVFRGRQGTRDYFAAIDDAFDDFRFAVEEIIDAGQDRVVVLMRIIARGKASGIPLDQRVGQVWTLQDGKSHRIDSYFDFADALEAAGLRE